MLGLLVHLEYKGLKIYHNIMPSSIGGFAGRHWQGSVNKPLQSGGRTPGIGGLVPPHDFNIFCPRHTSSFHRASARTRQDFKRPARGGRTFSTGKIGATDSFICTTDSQAHRLDCRTPWHSVCSIIVPKGRNRHIISLTKLGRR